MFLKNKILICLEFFSLNEKTGHMHTAFVLYWTYKVTLFRSCFFSYGSVYSRVGGLRYFHIYVGSEHYFGFKIPIKWIFWGVWRNCGFFSAGGGRGSLLNCTILVGYFYTFFFLFMVKIQNGNIFWGRTISNFFWVCLIFLILVWGK